MPQSIGKDEKRVITLQTREYGKNTRVVSSATIPTSSTTDASSSDEAFQRYHAKLMELYGEDQANLVKKESIFQPRVVVIVCVYLGPVAAGFTSEIVRSMSRDLQQKAAEWPDLMQLSGLASTVAILALSLRLAGRMRSAAAISLILLFVSGLTLFSSHAWLPQVCQIATGIAVGLHLPVYQLIVAETARPKDRLTLGCIAYSLFWLGQLLCMSAGSYGAGLDIKGLSILNIVVSVTHFVAVAFLHPETPRYLLAVKDNKPKCVDSMQWLRGRDADISSEYEDISNCFLMQKSKPTSLKEMKGYYDRSILTPLGVAATLLTLTALSGKQPVKSLLINRFNLHVGAQPSTNFRVIACGLAFAGSLSGAIMVKRTGAKVIILASASLMAASAVFAALLCYFWAESTSSWVLDTGAFIFLFSYDFGLGPLSWMIATIVIPTGTPMELGLAAVASLHAAFNLAMSTTFARDVPAVVIGVPGLFVVHAVVVVLVYGFILISPLPSPEALDRASLAVIERFFTLPRHDHISPRQATTTDEESTSA